MAAIKGSATVSALLLDKGARVDIRDADGATALHRAVEYGHTGILDLLLASKADINARAMQGYTPLLIASVRGFPEIVELLVTKGADGEVINEDGLNALHIAISYTDSIQTVERLIAGGTDVNASAPEGNTPLHIAASRNKIEIVRLLLAARAEINARTEDGWAPLHEAITASKEVVDLLLDNHADVNATSEYGYTPLHRAAANGKREVVRLLLQKGADTSLVDENGLSAIDFALEAGHSDIADLLIEHEHLRSTPVSAAPPSANQSDRTPGIVEDPSNTIPVASASAEHRFIEQQTCTCTGHWTIRLFSIVENADKSRRYILEKADVQYELCGQINMFYFQVDTYSPEYKNERLALFHDSDLLDLPVVGPWRDVTHLARHAALTAHHTPLDER